jgi:hypothetical protein
VHALADQVFAQNRTQRRLAVSPAGKRGGARSFQLDIAATLMDVDHLAEQKRTAIAELRGVPAELVPGIRLGQRFRAVGDRVAGENRRTRFRIERGGIKTQLLGQRMVELQQFRSRREGGPAPDVKALKGAGVAVIEVEARVHGVGRILRFC